MVLVLAGGSEDPSLHVGSFTSGEGLQTWMTLSRDAIPGMSTFPGGVILTTETGIQVVRP